MTDQRPLYAGWVPWRLQLTASEPLIDWCWLGRRRLTEPFFDNDIEIAMRTPFNTLFAHRTSLAALAAHYAESPGITPDGFIFHMSRCGSTLVSRMLAALPGHVVLSEASPLDWLARATAIQEERRAEWFLWMVSALAQRRAGNEIRFFIKFDSMTIKALPFLRRVFPGVPWVFLYREPEEVLVSQMRDPSPVMSQGVITDAPGLDLPSPQILEMSQAEFAARILGRLCGCAADGMDAHGLLVDYAELPGAVWSRIGPHFGLDVSAAERELMRAAAGFDAKHPRRRFEADGEGKRREAAGEIRAAAEEWILPAYREMLRAGLIKQNPVHKTKPMREDSGTKK